MLLVFSSTRKRSPRGQRGAKRRMNTMRERPRCAKPRGINETMSRKEADDKEMVLVGSGSTVLY